MKTAPFCAAVGLSLQAVVALSQTPIIDGPPAPVPPAVVNRDSEGRATVRAIRLDRPLILDGKLDGDVYATRWTLAIWASGTARSWRR
jgi:hypothetical protein